MRNKDTIGDGEAVNAPVLRRILSLPPHLRPPDGVVPSDALKRSIVEAKPFLKRLYTEWYAIFADVAERAPEGVCVELGSGAGFLDEMIPGTLRTEVAGSGYHDLACVAEHLPFASGSLSTLCLLDVLHHVRNPGCFFAEAARCLVPGGRVIMIEPYNTLWGSWVWRRFHHEPFLIDAGWDLPMEGPLSDANGALPWIVFSRDRARFEADYPELRITRVRSFMPLAYLLSGGVSVRSLVPGAAYPIVRLLEGCLRPLSNLLGMFAIIELTREP